MEKIVVKSRLDCLIFVLSFLECVLCVVEVEKVKYRFLDFFLVRVLGVVLF